MTCTPLVPFPVATENGVQPSSENATHQLANVDARLAKRDNATLGPLPLLGENMRQYLNATPQFGLGEVGGHSSSAHVNNILEMR